MKTEIIFLGGNNKTNISWIQELEASFKDRYHTHIHKYLHWDDNNNNIDFEVEKVRLKKHVDASTTSADFFIVAKSAGVILSLKCIEAGLIQPHQCVFIGIPIEWAKIHEIDYRYLLSKNSINTLYIQATSDPMGSFEALHRSIKSSPIVEFKSDNHNYHDIKFLHDTISNFFLDK